MTKGTKTALKAVRTRKARDNFYAKFGYDTYYIVKALLNNVPSNEIVDSFGISGGSLNAIKANLTRGTYAPFATSAGKGTAKL